MLTLTGTINPEASGSMLSSTTRLVQRDQIDFNATNDLVNVAINVQAETDLAVMSTFNPSSALPSSDVTLTVTVSNNGTLTAEDVAVQVALPQSLDFVSASGSHGLYDHLIGIWSIDSIDAGGAATLNMTVTIQTGTAAGTLSSTAAVLSASIGDPNPANNSMVGSVVVQAVPTAPDLLLPGSGTASNNQQPVFTWSQPSDAVGYELQLSPNNPPASTVYSGSANSYKPAAPLLAMTYYWRVRSVNADGNFSAWSDVWSVQITSLSSAAPERNMVTTATPTLSWGRISWAAGYEIEVDNNANFRSPEFEDDTLGPNDHSVMTDPLTNGKFYWRIRAKRVNGTWGNWSKPDSFVIRSN